MSWLLLRKLPLGFVFWDWWVSRDTLSTVEFAFPLMLVDPKSLASPNLLFFDCFAISLFCRCYSISFAFNLLSFSRARSLNMQIRVVSSSRTGFSFGGPLRAKRKRALRRSSRAMKSVRRLSISSISSWPKPFLSKFWNRSTRSSSSVLILGASYLSMVLFNRA